MVPWPMAQGGRDSVRVLPALLPPQRLLHGGPTCCGASSAVPGRQSGGDAAASPTPLPCHAEACRCVTMMLVTATKCCPLAVRGCSAAACLGPHRCEMSLLTSSAGEFPSMLPELEMKTLMDLEMALLVGCMENQCPCDAATSSGRCFSAFCTRGCSLPQSLLQRDRPCSTGWFGLPPHGVAPIHGPCRISSKRSPHRCCARVLVSGIEVQRDCATEHLHISADPWAMNLTGPSSTTRTIPMCCCSFRHTSLR
jgi:hypothetical protein